jgi:hypothetical protein
MMDFKLVVKCRFGSDPDEALFFHSRPPYIHAEGAGERRDAYRVFVENLRERLGCRWKDDIEICRSNRVGGRGVD